VPEIFVPTSLVHWPLLASLVAPFLTSLPPAVDVDEEANRLLDPVHPLWGSGLIASDAQQSSSARATTRARARHHHRPRCTSGRHLASTLPSRRRQPLWAPPTPPSPPLLPPLLPSPPSPSRPPPPPSLARRERRWHSVQDRCRHHLLVDISTTFPRRRMSWCAAASRPRLRCPACCRARRPISPYLQVTAWVEEGRHSGSGGLAGQAGGGRASWLIVRWVWAGGDVAASLAGWFGGQPHACQALLGVRSG
jgi:hypothetical protein